MSQASSVQTANLEIYQPGRRLPHFPQNTSRRGPFSVPQDSQTHIEFLLLPMPPASDSHTSRKGAGTLICFTQNFTNARQKMANVCSRRQVWLDTLPSCQGKLHLLFDALFSLGPRIHAFVVAPPLAPARRAALASQSWLGDSSDWITDG